MNKSQPGPEPRLLFLFTVDHQSLFCFVFTLSLRSVEFCLDLRIFHWPIYWSQILDIEQSEIDRYAHNKFIFSFVFLIFTFAACENHWTVVLLSPFVTPVIADIRAPDRGFA